MKVVVVVPTYNENENITRFINSVKDEFKKIKKHDCHILVVDGNSTDGTAETVEQFTNFSEHVHLIREKQKNGLGAAYIFGFKHAIKELNADVIVEMDADFQHNPDDLHRLIEKIDENYTCVIGSRFTKGGHIPNEWALYRRAISFFGNIFSRALLGILDVKDFTSGFKATRVHGFLDTMNLDDVKSKGFSYKMEILYKLKKMGARITEIPITFGVRDRGNSKMERSNLTSSLKTVLMLKFNENPSFYKFIIVGFIGLGVDTTIFNILRLFHSDPGLPPKISALAGLITTFTLNNRWSFSDKRKYGLSTNLKSFVAYFITSLVPIFVRSEMVKLFVSVYGNKFIPANVGFMCGIIFGLIWNFTIYSKIIWRKDSNA